MMKLWLLLGSYHTIVVRAETEQDARMIKKQDEITRGYGGTGDVYLDPKEYTCEEIPIEGKSEIIAEHDG